MGGVLPIGVREDGDDWLVCLLLQDHGEDWVEHDHLGKAYTKDATAATTAIASFGQDVDLVRQILSQAAAEGEVAITVEEAAALRWHGAKATLSTVMMHLDVGERAVRFAGNWKSAQESMPDAYLRESQLLVLRAQERALLYLREGGDVAVLEGVGLAQEGPGEGLGSSLDRVRGAKERLAATSDKVAEGLKVGDVSPGPLDKVGSEVAMETLEADELEREGAAEIDVGKIEETLGGPIVEEVTSQYEDVEVSSPEDGDTTSDDEFYTRHFLSAGALVRAALHKPGASDPMRPRCGVAAKRFHQISADEAISCRSSFCQRCFGRPLGCDKICSRLKQSERDGVTLRQRCMRRCGLSCGPVAKFLDEDPRNHLCVAHQEEFSGVRGD